ncbi:hypothetical protein QBC33DRAFT_165332 [Phialemonium atrogriseum]|uniref:Uncharacterized protein n=1 Tax=Phialemonium atrogriseum TaxID=1093897 RepID=A0AAJ0FT37_9PEZI|nr:uncharacterized protein QBC33DRAFT_165332 [Phialemonium atrogriseum]KAK1771750.1 hypothetical protein QBC33DRAFT_165332 [Phialemonium atrogriseum]
MFSYFWPHFLLFPPFYVSLFFFFFFLAKAGVLLPIDEARPRRSGCLADMGWSGWLASFTGSCRLATFFFWGDHTPGAWFGLAWCFVSRFFIYLSYSLISNFTSSLHFSSLSSLSCHSGGLVSKSRRSELLSMIICSLNARSSKADGFKMWGRCLSLSLN